MARRLAAILAADVVGYTAMMARDERATLARLVAFRDNVFQPEITRRKGRIVKMMGDGALVEFPSVVDAVACAIAIQSRPPDEGADPLRLRIGISLGDVIESSGDIFGDGVNLAARLEALADPGGICVSEPVRQSLGSKIDASFRDGGRVALKNLDDPVQVFHWSEAARQAAQPANAMAGGRASIAVLAFDNMSTDPEQEYFSDGIAEDLITALSHFRDFFVIARNTSFTYKGKAIRVDEVCRDLGIRYLVEGSVRKAGTRVRVTAQLIDGQTGAHIWAGKYDRELTDIFSVQDEITQAIVSAVAPETLTAEFRRARTARPDSLTAWDKVLRARWHLGRFTRDDNEAARRLLLGALEADAAMSQAHAALGLSDLLGMLHFWRGDSAEAIASAQQAERAAVALDDQNADAHALLGMANAFAREFGEAERCLSRAIALNPNLAIGHGNFAAIHGVNGDYGKAKDTVERALALSPRDPLRAFWRGGMGIAAYIAGDYEACIDNARTALRDDPGFASLMRQEAAALGMLGREQEARAAMNRLLNTMPGLTISQVRRMVPIRDPDDWERWLEGLRRAGMPE